MQFQFPTSTNVHMKIKRSFARCALVILATSATFSTSVRGVDLDPIQLGSWPGEAGKTITDVEVQGDYAYCTLSDFGLVVLDIGNADAPRKVGAFPTSSFGNPSRIVVSGSQAYVFSPYADSSGCGVDARIVMLDISDPTSPRLLGEPFGLCFGMGDGTTTRNIVISGSNLFLAGGSAFRAGGIEILDISNPTALQRAGGYSPPGRDDWILGLAVSGTRAFLGENRWDAAVSNYWGGLTILDVSDPATPRRIGRLEADAPGSLVRDVEVSGQNVLVVFSDPPDSDPPEVQIIDVSDAANPRRVAKIEIPPGLRDVADIALAGNLAYLVGGHIGLGESPQLGLEIFEITDLTNPRRIGSFARGALFQRVLRTGDKALVVDTGPESFEARGLRLINVNIPANPQRIGRYLPPRELTPSHAAASGHIVAVEVNGSIEFLDISDPINPRKLGEYGPPSDIHSLAMANGHAFVAGGIWDSTARLWRDAVRVIDITDPANPKRVGGIDLRYQPDLVIEGTRAFLFNGGPEDGNSGVQFTIFDVSNPAMPIETVGAELTIPDFTEGVSLYQGLLVAVLRGNTNTDLQLIDISVPKSPRVVGSVEVNISTYGLPIGRPAILGRYAYMGTRAGRLIVADLIDPTKPKIVGGNGAFPSLGPISSLSVATGGGMVFVSTFGEGLVFLEPFVTPLRLAATSHSDSAEFRLTVDGPTGRSARVERSENLRDWQDWRTVTLGVAPLELIDSAAEPRRFYRAATP